MTKYEEMEKFSKQVNESRDCAVKAVAIATDKEYVHICQMMYRHGRKPNDGTPNTVTKSVLTQLGFVMSDVTDKYKAKTVLTLGRQMKNVRGAFLVWVRGHILCIKDGEVCDWTNGRRHRIQKIVKVYFDNQHQMAAKDKS